MSEITTLFAMLKDWGGTVCLNFDENGMYIQAMDRSHVGCIDARLTKDWFSSYSVNRAVPIWVHTAYLHTVLQTAMKNGLNYLECTYDYDEPDYLNIYCKTCNVAAATATADEEAEDAETEPDTADGGGGKKGKKAACGTKGKGKKAASSGAAAVVANQSTAAYERHFQLTLVSMSENDAVGIGELDYTVDWVVDHRFINTMFDLNSVGGDINIHCNESVIELSAKGEMGKLTVPIPIDYCVEFGIIQDETVNVTYNLKMLCSMCATTKLTETVAISVGNDLPIRIRYELKGGSSVVFYMAPKVNDDEI